MNTKNLWVWLESCVTVGALGAQPTDILVVPAVQDNTWYESATGAFSNAKGPLFVGVTAQALIRRSLVQFAFADALVDPTKIDSVKLRMSVTTSIAANIGMRVHALRRSWGEGTSFMPSIHPSCGPPRKRRSSP